MTAPPRPSRAFEQHLDRVAGGQIIQFPAVVTRTLPMDDCSGPPFNPPRKPSGRIGRDGWQVPTTVIVGTLVVAALIFFGG